jgi:hypothetical protein
MTRAVPIASLLIADHTTVNIVNIVNIMNIAERMGEVN